MSQPFDDDVHFDPTRKPLAWVDHEVQEDTDALDSAS